jgi:Zn-dependent protease with chaperone function
MVDWGIQASDFILIESSEPVAFCFGFFHPRICLSTGFITLLSKTQLRAAVLHEDYHRQKFDPLRILLLEVFTKALFFLPVVQEYSRLYKIQLELAADRYAVERAGKAALAGALHRLINSVSNPNPSYGIIAGISANSARIAALLGDRSLKQAISLRSLLLSSLIIWLLCLGLML